MEARKNKKLSYTIFILLRLIIFAILILNIYHKNYENIFICVLSLLLFILPYMMEKKLKIEIPEMLEIIIFFFIFSAEILGEINSFYTKVPNWDTILHTINGFIMGAIGLSLIDLLNNNEKVSMKLSPFFVAIISLCFSMIVGVFWEFFEFGMDQIFHLDMQKDTVIQEMHSVTLDPDGLNKVHSLHMDSVVVNGEDFQEQYGGYIDIGLIDTMEDLIVNFVGAFIFSIIGYFYSKSEDQDKMKKLLIVPTKREEV